MEQRIELNFLHQKANVSGSYSFFDRKKGVVKIPSNKAEYFRLDYSSASDPILRELKKQYDEQDFHPGWVEGDRDAALSNIKFFLEIEYNDPTDETVRKKLSSSELKLYRSNNANEFIIPTKKN